MSELSEHSEQMKDHEEWFFGSVLMTHGHLTLELIRDCVGPSDSKSRVRIDFDSPASFGWCELVRMNEYFDRPQPVIQILKKVHVIHQDDLPKLWIGVAGFQLGETAIGKVWMQYEIAAMDEVLSVLTTRQPTINVIG